MIRSPFFRRSLHIATALYWTVLFVATHVPSPALPDLHVSDKLGHFIAYGLLGVLLFLSLTSRDTRRRIDVGIIVLAIGLAYGAVDEWLQALPFVHRDCELMDWFADAAGVALAVVVLSLLRAMWSRHDMDAGRL